MDININCVMVEKNRCNLEELIRVRIKTVYSDFLDVMLVVKKSLTTSFI